MSLEPGSGKCCLLGASKGAEARNEKSLFVQTPQWGACGPHLGPCCGPLTRQGVWPCFCCENGKIGSLVPQRLEETISSFRLAGLV